ncbi:DoxX family protein [Luteipulveratus mongoliensis]|uniref:DoxX family protein n=1 Tax=Luteipulveratus mongoliensis TaxID=571913 RepID=UPI000AE9FD48|nr:DoxX family protein [Luteipulveratus mongoliensis]
MNAINHLVHRDSVSVDRPSHARPSPTALHWLTAITRISLGWIFLWAFLDKTFGLGHETTNAQAWVNGGHPTYGFLHFSAAGPFKGFYHGIAGDAWADWLFMIGLAGIGIALVLGVATRVAAWSGALMLVVMWTVVLPPANNPFMDEHLIYAMVLLALPLLHAGNTLGLGQWWQGLPVISRHASLR